jgi:hypothetical protein
LNRRTAVLLTAVVLAAGCGGGGDAQGILRQTAARLPQIRSGTLDFRVLVVPRGRSARGKIGFAVHGPFALRARGSLPVLDITYTQLAGDKRATGRLVSNGTSAYAESNGQPVTLSAAQLAELRSATAQIQSNGGLGEFRIDDWIKHPSVSDGGKVGGARTDHVSADLDVVATANDLLGLGRGLGSSAPQLRGRNAKQLTDAVRHSSFDLWTGKKDRLLRRLRVTADVGLNVPQDLARALGDVVGAKVTFELAVSNPNRPVGANP